MAYVLFEHDGFDEIRWHRLILRLPAVIREFGAAIARRRAEGWNVFILDEGRVAFIESADEKTSFVLRFISMRELGEWDALRVRIRRREWKRLRGRVSWRKFEEAMNA